MRLFYRLFYSPVVNRILRNVFRFCGSALPSFLRIPVSGKVRLQISPQGQTIQLYTNPSNSMAKLLFWNELHNHEYTDIFLRLLPDVSVFVDIGASIGYYSIVANTVSPDIQVYAFEPADGPYHFLQRNFDLNRFPNARAYNIAVSDQQGSFSFYAPFNQKYAFLEHHLGGDGSLRDRPEATHLKKTTVKSRSLDSLIDELGITSIDLIKMDTEATEDRVLKGAKETITRYRPVIISEVLFNKIEAQLDEILSSWKYLIYQHDKDGLVRIPQLARSQDDGARNYFFVPFERESHFTAKMQQWIK